MTIAAGFLCPDGIVLGADTLYSGENKRYAAKLWEVSKGDNVVVFAGAGVATLIGKFKDDANRYLNETMTPDELIDALDASLSRIAKKAGDVPNVLVALRTSSRGHALLENDGGTVLTHVIKPSQCIGCGRALGLYFADSLFHDSMSSKWARVIVAHLLKQAKQYVDGCGGDSDIVTIPTHGPIEKASAAEIQDLEQYLADISEAVRMVLPSGSLNEGELALRLNTLNHAIRKARQPGYVLQAGVGQVMVVGDWISAALDFNSGPDTPLALKKALEQPPNEGEG